MCGLNFFGYIVEIFELDGDFIFICLCWEILVCCGDLVDVEVGVEWGLNIIESGWFGLLDNVVIDSVNCFYVFIDGSEVCN